VRLHNGWRWRDERRGVKALQNAVDLGILRKVKISEPPRNSPNALRVSIRTHAAALLFRRRCGNFLLCAEFRRIYRILKALYTPIFHRASATVVEPQIKRTLEKYG